VHGTDNRLLKGHRTLLEEEDPVTVSVGIDIEPCREYRFIWILGKIVRIDGRVLASGDIDEDTVDVGKGDMDPLTAEVMDFQLDAIVGVAIDLETLLDTEEGSGEMTFNDGFLLECAGNTVGDGLERAANRAMPASLRDVVETRLADILGYLLGAILAELLAKVYFTCTSLKKQIVWIPIHITLPFWGSIKIFRKSLPGTVSASLKTVSEQPPGASIPPTEGESKLNFGSFANLRDDNFKELPETKTTHTSDDIRGKHLDQVIVLKDGFIVSRPSAGDNSLNRG